MMDIAKRIRVAGADVQILVSSRETSGLYAICQVDLAAGQTVPEHAHRYEDVFFYVVKGAFEFDIGGSLVQALQGDSVFVPRQTPCSVRDLSNEPGRVLVFAQPGGLDLLFREAATAAAGPDALGPLLERHGIVAAPNPPSGK